MLFGVTKWQIDQSAPTITTLILLILERVSYGVENRPGKTEMHKRQVSFAGPF